MNCSGPGTIDQYVKYVKSGGFVPLPILEPERAVEAAMFALFPGTKKTFLKVLERFPPTFLLTLIKGPNIKSNFFETNTTGFD